MSIYLYIYVTISIWLAFDKSNEMFNGARPEIEPPKQHYCYLDGINPAVNENKTLVIWISLLMKRCYPIEPKKENKGWSTLLCIHMVVSNDNCILVLLHTFYGIKQ